MTNVEKMISLVDYDTFYNAVVVASGLKKEKVRHDVVKQYLQDWAVAKEKIFVMFGEKLWLESNVDLKTGRDEMKSMVHDLAVSYPKYYAAISMFTADDYINNCFAMKKDTKRYDELYRVFGELPKHNMKVSKFMSKAMNDPQFDIDLSKVLQNKSTKGLARTSIHPMDFLTLSTNTHRWGSCMSITDGFIRSGCFSLMLDEYTMISYLSSESEKIFQSDYAEFKWNDKIFRQNFHFSDDYLSFACAHYNGTVDSNVRSIWIDNVSKLIDSDCVVKERYDETYKGGEFYYDKTYRHECLPKDGKCTRKYVIGVKELTCVSCGKKFSKRHAYSGYIECKESGCCDA